VSRIVDAREERFGRYYEEFDVGDVYRHWPGKTITQAEENLFCLLTMAASPVHVDAHYAATEMDGGRNMVVGTYIYALLLGMSVSDTSGKAIAALGTEHLRHVAPLYHGDTLYGETTVIAVRPSASRPNAGVVTVDTRGLNQSGGVVCDFRRSFLVPKRAAAVTTGAPAPSTSLANPEVLPGTGAEESP
jgi:acyl dehydratase